jgi:hypothetical protein
MSIVNEEPAMTSLFSGMFIVNLLSVAIGGLFVNNDYTQNTIRNKIVAGHPRLNIYCAKLITVFVFYVMLTLVYVVPSFLINIFCLDTNEVIWEAMWKNFSLVTMTIVINAIITVFLAMAIRNVAGVVLPIAAAEGLPVIGTLALEVLSVSDMQILYKIIKSIPNIQTMMLAPSVIPTDILLSYIITLSTVTFLLTIGYLSFRTADLN